MKIYIGEDIWISKEDILGTFTSKTLLKSKDGRSFVSFFEKDLRLVKTEKEVKSYILTKDEEGMMMYESNISTDSIKNKVKSKGMKSLYE